jgi:hypothetical protein
MRASARRAAELRAVKWGAQFDVSAEQLGGATVENRRLDERIRDAVRSSSLFAPVPLVVSPAMAAALGVRGFDGRPAAHEPSPALVFLLLTDPRQERARV